MNAPQVQQSLGQPVSVSMAADSTSEFGRTAILRGTVATDEDRRLAEQLVLLEPGVAKVQNEITVRPQPAAETVPQP